MTKVIRNDPLTGEKINRIRKSYEGQIKEFGLSGRNKPVQCERKKEPADEAEVGPLRKAVGSDWIRLQSDEDWEASHAIPDITIDDSLRRKLRKGLELQPGPVNVKNQKLWEDLLGNDKPIKQQLPPQQLAQQHNAHSHAHAHHPPQRSRQQAADIKRATRGKKRSYDDDSFVGYGDGYSDVEDDGARDDDEDEERDGGSRKRRRH
jgi:hypothetical protein